MESKEHLKDFKDQVDRYEFIDRSSDIIVGVFRIAFFQDQLVVYKDLVVLRYFIFAVLEGYILFKITVYIRLLKQADYLDTVLVKKQDERLNYIKLKTNALTMKILIYAGGIALITAGFINRFMFYTLLSVLVFLLLVYLFVYLYYIKKY